ncbi:hypothetical protein SAMN04490190_4007 [Pseudomonas libanensis]|nr:hypothetical protein SAMN04490190_4007 [Pseudomonas libanensis]
MSRSLARSPESTTKPTGKRKSPVGAGLPAKAACQWLPLLLHQRFRRQASSHILISIGFEKEVAQVHQ